MGELVLLMIGASFLALYYGIFTNRHNLSPIMRRVPFGIALVLIVMCFVIPMLPRHGTPDQAMGLGYLMALAYIAGVPLLAIEVILSFQGAEHGREVLRRWMFTGPLTLAYAWPLLAFAVGWVWESHFEEHVFVSYDLEFRVPKSATADDVQYGVEVSGSGCTTGGRAEFADDDDSEYRLCHAEIAAHGNRHEIVLEKRYDGKYQADCFYVELSPDAQPGYQSDWLRPDCSVSPGHPPPTAEFMSRGRRPAQETLPDSAAGLRYQIKRIERHRGESREWEEAAARNRKAKGQQK